MDERRALSTPLDVAGAIAVLYTLGFLGTIVLMFFVTIPSDNKEAILQILGLMSAIEMAIIGAYFGQTKSGESMQRASAERQAKSEAVVQEIAKAVPTVAAIATGAPAQTAPIQADTVAVTGENVNVTGAKP